MKEFIKKLGEKYPTLKHYLDKDWVLETIHFKTDEEKEYAYFKEHGIETKMGGDCSYYFTKIRGIVPSCWGNCIAEAEVDELTPKSIELLQNLIKEKIYKISCFDLYNDESEEVIRLSVQK